MRISLICLLSSCVLLMALACSAATPSAYYQQSYAQIKTAAFAHLTSVGKSTQPYAVGIAPSLSRIYHEGGPALTWTGKVSLSAAIGETEHRELALVPVQTGVGLNDVQIALSSFTNGSGQVLETVTASPMLYVKTNSYTYSTTFDTPDVMFFQESGFNVDPNELQSLVIAVTVANNSTPGTYTGQVTIQPSGCDAEIIPVSITVYDFVLPYGPPIQTHVSSTRSTLMLDNRVQSCWWDPPFTDLSNITPQNWAAAAASVQDFFAVEGNTFMSIRTPGAFLNGGIVGGAGNDLTQFNSYTSTDIANMQTYWAGIASILADQGRLGQAGLWVWDEPGSTGITKVDDICGWIHTADSRLRTLCTDNKNNVRSLRQAGYVNIHVPETDVFSPTLDSPSNWAAGTEVWLYVCINPKSPWPNVMADNTPLDSRVLGWQIAYQGATGFLYWASQYSFDVGGNSNNWPDTDAGSMPSSGDGTLIHSPDGGTWQPSARLRYLADGLEDYIYVQILDELMARSDPANPGIPNTTEWQSARAAGQAALNQVATVAGTTMNTETTDPAVLMNARSVIAESIMTLQDLLGPETCGDVGQKYYGADISGPEDKPDCQVDLYDFGKLVQQWTHCTDPCNSNCDHYFPPVYY